MKGHSGRFMVKHTLLLAAALALCLAVPKSTRCALAARAQDSSARPSALFNTRLHATAGPWAGGEWVAVQGNRDLNGDGDTADDVLQIYDTSTGQTWNSGLAAAEIRIAGDWAEADTPEASQGNKDLNGDGDRSDTVPQLINLNTHEILN